VTRLELTWPNKERFLLVPKDNDGKPVWVDRDHPAAAEVRVSDFTAAVGQVNETDPYADNLLFTGDSLDVLRILTTVPEYARRYKGKVRLVYIDPPFNTGQAFEHYDDWLEHATWLSFMRERLLSIRELLAPDGSLWLHLDDVEQHRMRVLLDEVFGSANAVGTVVWEKTRGAKGDTDLSTSHDYISIYAVDRARWKDSRNLLPRTAAQAARYANPDDDPRGSWRQGADGTAKSGSESLRFPITLPSGRIVTPPSGNYWRFTAERFEEALADGRVYFGKNGDSLPVIKTYLAEIRDGVVPQTWWPSNEVGSNQEAKRDHLRKMFPGEAPFATPKPERLLERILTIASSPGDIVLDCFAGSGTTAAVAHKMGRRWVTAEVLPETVQQFTLRRLELVVNGEDSGGITNSVAWAGGGGFRAVEVGPSMYVDTPFGVLLSDEATNGTFAKAVAGQLRYEFQPDAAPLCGVQGRMRLAVLDGAVGDEEVRAVVSALGEGEQVEIVGRSMLEGASATLTQLSKGSKITKAPRDLLTAARRIRRHADREVDE
jgi:adenine-specific DNA-methyltransferase